MTTITYEKALELIRGLVIDEGSQIAVAKKLDVSVQYLNDILHERRAISDSVARRLPPHGYRRVIFFERLFKEDIGDKIKATK
jgi:hypothetical protein